MVAPAAPVRASRSALAPKLMRRASGETGEFAGASPSSTALSSNMAELVPALETLSRREAAAAVKGDVCVGEHPDRPSVEMDTRRLLCALAAAAVMGPGKADVPATGLAGVRAKMLVKAWPGENDARLSRAWPVVPDGGLLSLDMAGVMRA